MTIQSIGAWGGVRFEKEERLRRGTPPPAKITRAGAINTVLPACTSVVVLYIIVQEN